MISPNTETACWAFIGTCGDTEIRWSTQPIEGYEPRLIEPPAAWAVGMVSSASGTVELASSSLTLDNADGALNRFFLGMPLGSTNEGEEYLDSSLLDLKGRLCRVVVVSQNTVRVEEMSPPMVLSGEVTSSPGRLEVSLVADAEGTLGRARSLQTVWELTEEKDFEVVYAGGAVREIYKADLNPDAAWEAIRSLSEEHADAVVPWIYGGSPVKLLQIGRGDLCHYIEGVGLEEESVGSAPVLKTIRDGQSQLVPFAGHAYRFGVRIGDVELVCYTIPESVLKDSGVEGELWAVPQVLPWHPTEDMVRLLEEQCPGGEDAFHPADLMQLGDSMTDIRQAFAGVIESETTVGEILGMICAALGLRAWIGMDGKLAFALRDPPRSEWEGVVGLPVIEPHDDLPVSLDGMPSWSEVLQSDPDDVRSAASRVFIEWQEWARVLYPESTRTTLSQDVELPIPTAKERIIPGDWLHPSNGYKVLALAIDRAAWPIRSVSVAVPLAVMQIPIGSYVRVSSDWGHKGIGLGWEGRLARLVRIEVRPGDECAVATLEDMGSSEAVVPAMLDSYENWILMDFREMGGAGFLFRHVKVDGEDRGFVLGFDAYGFTPYRDMTIWALPSRWPGREGECSYRVLDDDYEVGGLYGVLVDPPMFPSPVPVAASEVLVMNTYVTGMDGMRPGYIAAASDDRGRLTEDNYRDDPPFRFTRI